MAFQIIFYLKSGLNHHPQITKKKQPKVFEQFFTDLPPRKAGVQKYLRPGPTSGGTFALPSSGASMFYWFFKYFSSNNHKNGSGTKKK